MKKHKTDASPALAGDTLTIIAPANYAAAPSRLTMSTAFFTIMEQKLYPRDDKALSAKYRLELQTWRGTSFFVVRVPLEDKEQVQALVRETKHFALLGCLPEVKSGEWKCVFPHVEAGPNVFTLVEINKG